MLPSEIDNYQLRKVVTNDRYQSKSDIILQRTEALQEYHIISNDIKKKLKAGDFVLAQKIFSTDSYSLFGCSKLPENRMILELFEFDVNNQLVFVYWNKDEFFYPGFKDDYLDEIKQLTQMHTEHKVKLFQIRNHGGNRSELFVDCRMSLFLIAQGEELKVKKKLEV